MVNKPLHRVTVAADEPQDMTNSTTGKDKWYQDAAAAQIHMEQLKTVERFNGRAAMLGFVIGVITEGLTGEGIIHQIGLGPLVDGYAACSTAMLPFCG
nr:hypothetical protein 11 [bacterium]